MAEQPYEIIAAPLSAYIAPVGEPFPVITLSPPAGNWVLIGSSGADNVSEDGVTVHGTEEVTDFRSLGGTGIKKSFRTLEDILVQMKLHDLTLEQLAQAFNMNTVTTGVGERSMDLYKGGHVATRALLVRGVDASPYGDGHNLQFELPRVRLSGQPEMIFKKDEPVGLDIAFMVMEDLNAASDAARFGKILVGEA